MKKLLLIILLGFLSTSCVKEPMTKQQTQNYTDKADSIYLSHTRTPIKL